MLVQKWHGWLQQPKYDKAWHEQDVADELEELRQAKGVIHHWSELSDVVYTVSRARWSGHDLAYPLSRGEVLIGHVYMYPKYSLRTVFFRSAGRKAGSLQPVHSVRNPKKTHKLAKIAKENNIDQDLFIKICES